MGEASLDKPEASSFSDDDSGPRDNDSPLIRVNRCPITVKKMDELVLKYRVPSGHVYKIPTINKYVSTFGPLKIRVRGKLPGP